LKLRQFLAVLDCVTMDLRLWQNYTVIFVAGFKQTNKRTNKQFIIRLWQPLTKAVLHRHTKLHNIYIMQWRYWNYCQWF